jgi:Transglycosylase-like domain
VPVAAVSEWSPADVGSSGAHTCPSIGSAALEDHRLVHRDFKRTLAALMIVALFVGVSATAARAAADPTPTLRAQVDAVGSRFFAAQARARTLDAEIRRLDQRLAQTRRRAAVLHPVATAQAVQLYQSRTQGFSAVFDTANAMESARRAVLIARASDHTQALLDRYANTNDTLVRQRAQLARARAEQGAVVATLARQRADLERALARAQQIYRERLAARAAAIAAAAAHSTAVRDAAAVKVAAPTAPVRVDPPPSTRPGLNPHHDDPFLVCTRTRESAGDYTAVNLSGYYGAYQFSQPTWDVTANHAGSPQLIGVRPDLASAWDQDQLAWVLYQWQGNGPWSGLC